jgi:hypothetical protein
MMTQHHKSADDWSRPDGPAGPVAKLIDMLLRVWPIGHRPMAELSELVNKKLMKSVDIFGSSL